jgi:hypothetical protein
MPNKRARELTREPFEFCKVAFKWLKPLILRHFFYGTGQNRTAVQNGYLPSDRSQVYPL